ncbi:MAG: hypothetical protein V7L29_17810 [Nostoc sp.]
MSTTGYAYALFNHSQCDRRWQGLRMIQRSHRSLSLLCHFP